MTTSTAPDIVCIGAVLWDTIGRSASAMRPGGDVPGRITRLPGGVALNIAMALRRLGLTPTLLTALGADLAGDELLGFCHELGIRTEHVHRTADLPTDRYIGIEDPTGLVAAIADVHSLETVGAKILLPLFDGRLGSPARPWPGLIALDGNLTEALLAEIAASPCFAAADLRVVSASSGKVERLRPLLNHPRLTLYVNREEACLLCQAEFPDSGTAAKGLLSRGVHRVLVTDGPRNCTDGMAGANTVTLPPPKTRVNRVTGAGDVFLSAHIVAERRGAARPDALTVALQAASHYVSGEIGT